jgi:hypothetical protein
VKNVIDSRPALALASAAQIQPLQQQANRYGLADGAPGEELLTLRLTNDGSDDVTFASLRHL